MGKLKRHLTLWVVAAILVFGYIVYNASSEGIHPVGKDAVLIEGECITINWDASEETWQQAHAKWQALRGKSGHGLSSK